MGSGSGDSSVPGEKQSSKVRVTGEWYQGCPCQQFQSALTILSMGDFEHFHSKYHGLLFAQQVPLLLTIRPSSSHLVKLLPCERPLDSPWANSPLLLDGILKNRLKREENSQHILRAQPAHIHCYRERERERETEWVFNTYTQIWQYSTFTTIYKHK